MDRRPFRSLARLRLSIHCDNGNLNVIKKISKIRGIEKMPKLLRHWFPIAVFVLLAQQLIGQDLDRVGGLVGNYHYKVFKSDTISYVYVDRKQGERIKREKTYPDMPLYLNDVIGTREDWETKIYIEHDPINYSFLKLKPNSEFQMTKNNCLKIKYASLLAYFFRNFDFLNGRKRGGAKHTLIWLSEINNKMQVLVAEGAIVLENDDGRIIVRANEIGTVYEIGKPTKERVPPHRQIDIRELHQWKRELRPEIQRDRRFSRLQRSFYFTTLNTGFHGLDIRESPIENQEDAIGGTGMLKIKIDIK